MSQTVDIALLRSNGADFARNKNAREVLQHADGKTTYRDIAKAIGAHPTVVSSLLKKAGSLGLARKLPTGKYKKIPGAMAYVPKVKKSKKAPPRTVANVIQKLTGKKKIVAIPTFSPSPSIDANLERMTKAYRLLYATENVLRELIRKVIGEQVNWWTMRVPQAIRTVVGETMSREPYHAVKRKDELEYTHLGQLKEIIVNGRNWNDFLPYLNERDKNTFASTISRAIPSRNATGHCIPLTQGDFKVVEVRFTDILGMLK